MAEQPQEEGRSAREGERRDTDRRATERRRRERRAPPPPWRRWWALVSYGVVGALVVVLLWGRATSKGPAVVDEPIAVRSDSVMEVVETPPPAAAGVEDARGAEGFQRLVVGGEASAGRIVRAELFCGNASNFTIIQGHPVPRSVAGLIHEGRVGAAECKWGESSAGQSRPDFLLLIPPALADEFASAPIVTDNYVERRRLVAEVEWVGRSETLALRTGGVFRGRAR